MELSSPISPDARRRATIQRCLLALIVASTSTLVPCAARAQSKYPDRPIRLVIPFPPGGVYDSLARPLADRLQRHLGSVVVENMGGAAGTRGTAAVARAPADGYTLLLAGTGALVIAPIARRPLYDSIQDFGPISRIAVVGICFVVGPSVPVRDMKELLAYTKANSSKLTFGSTGAGTVNHLTIEMFKKIAGTPNVAHLPHTGGGPLLNDVVGGHIPLGVLNVTGNVLALHRQGKVRVLAVTNPERLASAPDIPTMADAGLRELNALVFAGLFAPKGTPRAIVDQIAEATKKALADSDLQAVYLASGFLTDLDSSPEKMGTFLRAELLKWRPIVEEVGFKAE